MEPKKNTVYITQEATKFVMDSAGAFAPAPAMDYSPAMRYGDIDILLPPGKLFNASAPIISILHAKLSKWKDGDYLLASGHPASIAMASAVLATYTRSFPLLIWIRAERGYSVVTITV